MNAIHWVVVEYLKKLYLDFWVDETNGARYNHKAFYKLNTKELKSAHASDTYTHLTQLMTWRLLVSGACFFISVPLDSPKHDSLVSLLSSCVRSMSAIVIDLVRLMWVTC